MPSRALHTWQIKLVCRLRSLIFCSSQNPISRNRWVTSGGAESCLMRTSTPVRILLKGHRNGCGQCCPSSWHCAFCDSFTRGMVCQPGSSCKDNNASRFSLHLPRRRIGCVFGLLKTASRPNYDRERPRLKQICSGRSNSSGCHWTPAATTRRMWPNHHCARCCRRSRWLAVKHGRFPLRPNSI